MIILVGHGNQLITGIRHHPNADPISVYDITNPNTGEVISPSKKAWKYQRILIKTYKRRQALVGVSTGKILFRI